MAQHSTATHLLQQALKAVDQYARMALPPRCVLGRYQRQLGHLRPKHAADGGYNRLALQQATNGPGG
jgi:hypothetical protein